MILSKDSLRSYTYGRLSWSISDEPSISCLSYSPTDSTTVNLSRPPKQENHANSRIQSKIDRLQRDIERFWTEIFSLIALHVESRSQRSSFG